MLFARNGRVAELADALDLKSSGGQPPCGFESRLGHTFKLVFEKILHTNHYRSLCWMDVVSPKVSPKPNHSALAVASAF